jgi:hypothetical protein
LDPKDNRNLEIPAQGQRGILISGFDGRVYFRQYDANHEFVDYEVTNYDVEIEILDPHAALIRNSRGDFLDYTAESMNVVSNSDLDPKPDHTVSNVFRHR